MSVSRRKFLGSSGAFIASGLAAGCATTQAPTAPAVVAADVVARGKTFGPNDRIGVCVIGFNGQGNSHIREVMAQKGAEVVALCDADEKVIERGVESVKEGQGKAPKTYTDMRDVMADDSIDAVTIATPNHWHSLATIWACQAGKDVYVEKPLSHNIWEGRQLVAAANKYGRVVMHGTQSRTDATLIRDIKLMHEGFIGKIVHSRGYVYKNGNRRAIGHGERAAPPKNLHWTLWQGPSKDHPYMAVKGRKRGLYVHYNWHWFWEYGNGEIGNQGVHEMDLACWGHNRGLPVKIMSQGGRYGWDDDGESPNTHATSFMYADGSMMTFEVRNLGSFEEAGGGACGNSFFGTEGYYVRRKGFFNYQNEPIPVEVEKPRGKSKFTHFFDVMRSRKMEDCPAPPLAGHLSCVHCHLGNIAYRIGRSLEFDPRTERFVGDDEANALIKRDYRNGFEPPQLA
jgi:predicted dehydrogenase